MLSFSNTTAHGTEQETTNVQKHKQLLQQHTIKCTHIPWTFLLWDAFFYCYNHYFDIFRYLYRRNKKGITAKLDDDLLKFYCNEDTFLMQVWHCFVAKAAWKTHPWSLNMKNHLLQVTAIELEGAEGQESIMYDITLCELAEWEPVEIFKSEERRSEEFFSNVVITSGAVYSTPPACQRFINYAVKLL